MGRTELVGEEERGREERVEVQEKVNELEQESGPNIDYGG